MTTSSELVCYQLLLSYCGTKYSGWQKQPNSHSIQAEIEKALRKISKSDEIKTLAAGRTDAGVHALGQLVRIQIPLKIAGDSLQKALNTNLPEDIRVREAHACDPDFHPIRDTGWKEYWYMLTFNRPGPFHFDHVGYLKRQCTEEKLKSVAKLFEGRHDFASFMCTGTPVNSTLRTIYESEIQGPFSSPLYFPPQVQGELSGAGLGMLFPVCYLYRVVGEGFLKQMVRLMVGTLAEVASGRVTEDQLQHALDGGGSVDHRLGPVAPAGGLYLAQVGIGEYPGRSAGPGTGLHGAIH